MKVYGLQKLGVTVLQPRAEEIVLQIVPPGWVPSIKTYLSDLSLSVNHLTSSYFIQNIYQTTKKHRNNPPLTLEYLEERHFFHPGNRDTQLFLRNVQSLTRNDFHNITAAILKRENHDLRDKCKIIFDLAFTISILEELVFEKKLSALDMTKAQLTFAETANTLCKNHPQLMAVFKNNQEAITQMPPEDLQALSTTLQLLNRPDMGKFVFDLTSAMLGQKKITAK